MAWRPIFQLKKMSADANTLVVYSSVYRFGVDSQKRRLSLPAKWRKPQADGEETLTLLLWKKGSQQEPCLLALPADVMRGIIEKMKSMPMSDPRAEALRRLLGANSDQVTVDKQGRFCLPETLAKAAGIDGQAVLVGMFDRFQIWNPTGYDAAAAQDEALRVDAYALI